MESLNGNIDNGNVVNNSSDLNNVNPNLYYRNFYNENTQNENAVNFANSQNFNQNPIPININNAQIPSQGFFTPKPEHGYYSLVALLATSGACTTTGILISFIAINIAIPLVLVSLFIVGYIISAYFSLSAIKYRMNTENILTPSNQRMIYLLSLITKISISISIAIAITLINESPIIKTMPEIVGILYFLLAFIFAAINIVGIFLYGKLIIKSENIKQRITSLILLILLFLELCFVLFMSYQILINEF